MFKSVISGLIAVSVLATPVVAEARGREEYRERHHGVNTGEAIAIGLGALILGAAIGGRDNRNDRYEDRDYDRDYDRPVYRGRDSYYRPDRNCYSTIVTEYDYYGNRYTRREVRCF